MLLFQIYTNINAKEIRKLGKLFHGMPTNIIMMMKKDTIEEALDDFDDLDLSDAMKKTIAEKVSIYFVMHKTSIFNYFLG